MTQKPEKDEPLFSRWSRRKLDLQANDVPDDSLNRAETSAEASATSESENEDESALPLWLQENVDPDVKRAALASLFREPEFNVVDRMNEYDEDFTQFKGLGDIVTQQMKHMLKVAEQKTRPDDVTIKPNLDNHIESEIVISDGQITQVDEATNDNEDSEIA